MNAAAESLPLLFNWPSLDKAIAYATVTINELCNGAAYERSHALPKLLYVPEFWHIAGNGPHDPEISEQILADLEGLLAAQVQHLQRGRIQLFDHCRFWALIQACRGERRIFDEQLRRAARHRSQVEEAVKAANQNREASEDAS